jgi:hypothetical protein
MKKIILSALILFVFVPILKSQVTIGSSNEPAKAALVDLKTQKADNNNVTVKAGDAGGLVLARVRLVDKMTLEPFISKTSEDWRNKETEMRKSHIGMMVYNLEKGKGFSPGIYVWTTSGWVQNTLKVANGLTLANDSIRLGGTLNDSTTIDLGKNYLAFEGNSSRIYMHNVKNNLPKNTDKIAALGIDDGTGELFIMKANNEKGTTTKAINYLVYELSGEGDWIQNFDTKINASEYTVVVVGSSFIPKTTYSAVYPAKDANYSIPVGATAISNVFADRLKYVDNVPSADVKSTWFLHADYVGAAPEKVDDHGIWTINCLVFNNSLVNVHRSNPITYGLGGEEDLKAGNAPSGLQ